MAYYYVEDITIRPVAVTITHKLDPDQFTTLIATLSKFSSSDDSSQVADLTAKLKASADALSAAEAAAQPQPKPE